MWLVESFCVGAIHHSARSFGASGRTSGQALTSLDGQSAHTNLNHSFPHRPMLIRGDKSRAAQHRHATDALCRRDFTSRWLSQRGGFGQVRANPTGRG